jgi:hypothetical protein
VIWPFGKDGGARRSTRWTQIVKKMMTERDPGRVRERRMCQSDLAMMRHGADSDSRDPAVNICVNLRDLRAAPFSLSSRWTEKRGGFVC